MTRCNVCTASTRWLQARRACAVICLVGPVRLGARGDEGAAAGLAQQVLAPASAAGPHPCMLASWCVYTNRGCWET
eukprot:359321-Chlamydomonas_euryale.AAC.5